MAQDELRTIQVGSGLPPYSHQAGLMAWQMLAAGGHMHFVDPSLDAR
jgi:hypothetical protein